MLYKEKLIISGRYLEHFKYERYMLRGFKVNKWSAIGRSGCADEDQKIRNRAKTTQRAKSHIKRLINSNIGVWKNSKGDFLPAKFLTLTYGENATDIKSLFSLT